VALTDLLRKIPTAIKNPGAVSLFLRRNAIYQPHRYYHRQLRGKQGIDIMDADWDTIVVLDACRYDVFSEEVDLPGELSEVISRGSATAEFVAENFQGQHYDTVYVTGNPSVNKHLSEDRFHDVINVWKDEWDEELGTVLPSDMYAATKAAHERYPHKRIISHFLQPHQPFIGDKGRALYEESEYGSTVRGHRKSVIGDDAEWETRNIFLGLFEGELNHDEVWEAYAENLREVVPWVERIVTELDGRSVVTSDHGNIFQQPVISPTKPPSAHPGGIYLDKLVRVPWLVVDGPRRTVRSERPTEHSEGSGEAVPKERLRDLGYVQED
jgi:hypothetical protein